MILYFGITLAIIINEKISISQTSDLNYSLYADDKLIAKNIQETAFRARDKNVVKIIPYMKNEFVIRFGKDMYLYRHKLKKNKKVSVEKMVKVVKGFRWNVFEHNDGHKIGYKDFCLEVGNKMKDSEDKVVTLQQCSEKSSQVFDSARIPIVTDSLEDFSEEKGEVKNEKKSDKKSNKKSNKNATEESESVETNYEDLDEIARNLYNSSGRTVKFYINNYKPTVYSKIKKHRRSKHSHHKKREMN